MDESKLPKWAQQELARLRSDVRGLERQLADTAVADTDVYLRDYTHGNRGLPAHSVISFKPQVGEEIEVQIREGKVQIYGEAGCNLHILPVASNTAAVVALPWQTVRTPTNTD